MTGRRLDPPQSRHYTAECRALRGPVGDPLTAVSVSRGLLGPRRSPRGRVKGGKS